MAESERSPVTLNLSQDAASGSASAAEKLLPLVYDELRRVAQRQINSEQRDHTLLATALVREAYLKLVGPRDVPWQNKAHFFAAAAEEMRRILIAFVFRECASGADAHARWLA